MERAHRILRTFGRLALLDADGREDPALATRPRKLAVLTWLALRPGRRATRDRIIGVFWGGRAEERARNSLSDVLSHLRRVLGRDAIRTEADEVLLADATSIDVDSIALTEAHAAGDHERVVALYTGSFLDGVYVDDAPEFEDWRERERARLAALFARSAAVICEQHARAKRWEDCRALAERWLDVAPASAGAALQLLKAISAPGTQASRVAMLDAYESLVRRLERDLGVGPDPAVTELARDVAAELAASPPPLRREPIDALAEAPRTIHGARPMRRRALAAFGIVVVTLLAALGAIAFQRPRAPIPPRRVVVAPLENLTGDPSLDAVGRVASDWIAQGIAQADSLDVVSPATVSITLGEVKGPYAELIKRLTTRTDARLLVSGGYLRRGDSLQFQVQITDARTGRLLRAVDPAAGPARDPFTAIDVLRDRLLGALAPEDRATVGLSNRVPRYSAYQDFLRGHERFIRYRDYEGGRRFLRHAIELDSSLAVAWVYLATSYHNQGMYDSMEVVVRGLAARRDRLTHPELQFLDFLEATLRGDTRGAVRSQQAIAARDSNPIWLYVLGLDATRLNQPRLALAALAGSESAAVVLNWHAQFTVTADAYHEAGRYTDELATLEHARGIFPNVRTLVDRELIALAGLRRGPQALALADSILAATTDLSGGEAGTIVTGAMDFLAHGDSTTGVNLARKALAWWASHPVPQLSRSRAVSEAVAFRLTGRLDSAETRLVLAARDTMFVEAGGLLALIRFERIGDRVALQHAADSIGALQRRWLFGAQHTVQAALVAELGDRDRALVLLRRAIEEGQQMQTLHRTTILESLWSYPAFRALLSSTE